MFEFQNLRPGSHVRLKDIVQEPTCEGVYRNDCIHHVLIASLFRKIKYLLDFHLQKLRFSH